MDALDHGHIVSGGALGFYRLWPPGASPPPHGRPPSVCGAPPRRWWGGVLATVLLWLTFRRKEALRRMSAFSPHTAHRHRLHLLLWRHGIRWKALCQLVSVSSLGLCLEGWPAPPPLPGWARQASLSGEKNPQVPKLAIFRSWWI